MSTARVVKRKLPPAETKSTNSDRINRLALGYVVSPLPTSEDVVKLKEYYDLDLNSLQDTDKRTYSAFTEKLTEGYSRLRAVWDSEYLSIQERFTESPGDQVKALNTLKAAVTDVKDRMLQSIGNGAPLTAYGIQQLVRERLPYTQEHHAASAPSLPQPAVSTNLRMTRR